MAMRSDKSCNNLCWHDQQDGNETAIRHSLFDFLHSLTSQDRTIFCVSCTNWMISFSICPKFQAKIKTGRINFQAASVKVKDQVWRKYERQNLLQNLFCLRFDQLVKGSTEQNTEHQMQIFSHYWDRKLKTKKVILAASLSLKRVFKYDIPTI